MTNILIGVVGNASVTKVDAENGNLRAIAFQSGGFDQISDYRELRYPGIYVCVTPSGRLYVGYGADVMLRAYRFSHSPERPALMLYIVGGKTPLADDKAKVIERIAFQALSSTGHRLVNAEEPFGEPIDQQRYAEIQCDWAAIVHALGRIVPSLACPWIEPLHAKLRKPHPDDPYHEDFYFGKTAGLRASLKKVKGGYLIQPGSQVRNDPTESAGGLAHLIRIECRYAGLLVPEQNHLRLTRPVFRETLTGCSQFLFTTYSTGIWRRVPTEISPMIA